jgi:pyruvate dehydrogenase complex dehydrogenase (E1) component
MSDEGYWAIALVLGLVVAVVAVVLLEVFLRQVHRVERGADAVWTAGKQVARNTATTWLLPETSKRLDLLTDEAMQHVALLTPAPARTSTKVAP